MRQSTKESVLESCNNVQTMSADGAAKIAQGWRELAVFSRQLNPHNTELHIIYDKLAEMFDARAWEAHIQANPWLKEELLGALQAYDDATRGTFDAEGRVRS